MAKKKPDLRASYEAAAAHGRARHAREAELLERVTGAKVEAMTLPLDAILDRAGGDVRPVDPTHVFRLAAAIGAVGLIQPLAVDEAGRLLAGRHRLEALRLLALEAGDREAAALALEEQAGKDGDGEAWAAAAAAEQWRGPVPVHRIAFDAEADPGRALALEVAENEQRRDFTAADVARAADKLRGLGYRDTPGRPKAGEKALRPALSAIFRVNRRTIQRALSGDLRETAVTTAVSADVLMRRARKAAEAAAEALKGSRGPRGDVRRLATELAAAVALALGEDGPE